jgi:hypothetical protein
MKSEIVELIVPNWALGALINGDLTIATFYGSGYFIFKEDVGFRRRNDIDRLGADCSMVFIVADKDYMMRQISQNAARI